MSRMCLYVTVVSTRICYVGRIPFPEIPQLLRGLGGILRYLMMWGVPKMGVPNNGLFMVYKGKHLLKCSMDDFWGTPFFGLSPYFLFDLRSQRHHEGLRCHCDPSAGAVLSARHETSAPCGHPTHRSAIYLQSEAS